MATNNISTNQPTSSKINYNSRDFASLKKDLITYAKNYHSDVFSYLNDASPDIMFIELLSYIGDNLNYHTDKAFNEAFRGTAQSIDSLINISQDLGFYDYYPKPSITQAVVSIDVPAIANSDGSAMIPNPNYMLGLYSGLKCQSSNGSMFECLDEINFASSNLRTIIPNYDSNNVLINYTINKAITLYAGSTFIQRYYVGSNNAQPFLEVFIDDANVSEIIGIVPVIGNTYNVPDDSAFRDLNNIYLQVEHLAQSEVFIPMNSLPNNIEKLVNQYTDMSIQYGQWVNFPKRFIVRRDSSNRTKIIFGSTLLNYSTFSKLIGSSDITSDNSFSINDVLNNFALGQVPDINTTLFIQYRSGSGVSTNALNNQITNIISKEFFPTSQIIDYSSLDIVRSSLKITSNLPAIGGTDAMTTEELRNSIGGVFAANDRVVTHGDIQALINKMPPEFGAPFRISYEEIKPKVLNYNQINNYVSTQLDSLMTLNTSTDRAILVSNMKSFLNDLPTQNVQITQSGQTIDIATSSNQILTNTPSLWVGERCRLYILGIDKDSIPTSLYLDENGIWKSANSIMKQNIKNWLVTKRIIGDWIDIMDAFVVNFQIEFTIMADSKNKQKVLIDCLTKLRDYFNVYNWQINQPIYIANVATILQQIDGVINVVNIKFWNIFDKDIESGKQYSPAQYGRYFNNTNISYNSYNNKFLMGNVDNVIQSQPHVFLNLRNPEIDIRGNCI